MWPSVPRQCLTLETCIGLQTELRLVRRTLESTSEACGSLWFLCALEVWKRDPALCWGRVVNGSLLAEANQGLPLVGRKSGGMVPNPERAPVTAWFPVSR
jgi:hypothetical protein